MTTIQDGLAPDALNESLDPRDPLLRLSTFFDDGTARQNVKALVPRNRARVMATTLPSNCRWPVWSSGDPNGCWPDH